MTKRVAYVVAAILILAQSGPASAAPPSSLGSAFASAAIEFSVPQNVLLGVSYVVSRWETDTRPSAARGARSRPDVAKYLAMCFPNLLPIGDILDIHASAHNILHARTGFFQS